MEACEQNNEAQATSHVCTHHYQWTNLPLSNAISVQYAVEEGFIYHLQVVMMYLQTTGE